MISASEADGARESGLTAMIWNQVMSYAADAMVTVALAGTVFFSAPSEAQRGNVLLYLLMTMAPFAVVAPVIGPALDRVQHGRRWVMAGTAIGRGGAGGGDGDELHRPATAVPGRARLAGAVQGLRGDPVLGRAPAGADRT